MPTVPSAYRTFSCCSRSTRLIESSSDVVDSDAAHDLQKKGMMDYAIVRQYCVIVRQH